MATVHTPSYKNGIYNVPPSVVTITHSLTHSYKNAIYIQALVMHSCVQSAYLHMNCIILHLSLVLLLLLVACPCMHARAADDSGTPGWSNG